MDTRIINRILFGLDKFEIKKKGILINDIKL